MHCLTWIASCRGRTDFQIGCKDWKYFDQSIEAPKDWTKIEFDDKSWKSGQAPLGYGDGDVKQKVSFGDDERNKRNCVFFRKKFEVSDLEGAKKLIGRMNVDDGCVVFLNGKEIHRFNLPKGEIKKDTRAILPIGGNLERVKMHVIADVDKLKKGANVLAIRVHQCNEASSDLHIDVSLEVTGDEERIKAVTEKYEEEQKLMKQYLEQFKQQQEQQAF